MNDPREPKTSGVQWWLAQHAFNLFGIEKLATNRLAALGMVGLIIMGGFAVKSIL